jgi:hypothetical protein
VLPDLNWSAAYLERYTTELNRMGLCESGRV